MLDFTQEQQALVDKLVGDARTKARDKAKSDHETQSTKDREAADQAALIAQKEWQTLAEAREGKIQELEPLVAQVTAFEEMVAGMLKDSLESLGDAARKAMKGLPESMSTIERLEWLKTNQELFQASGGGVGTPKPPTTRTSTRVEPVKICKYPLRF